MITTILFLFFLNITSPVFSGVLLSSASVLNVEKTTINTSSSSSDDKTIHKKKNQKKSKKPLKLNKKKKRKHKKVSKKHKKSSKKRYRCNRRVSKQYNKMKRRWQKIPKIPKPKWREGFRDLTLISVNLGEKVRMFPFWPDGTLDTKAVDAVTNLMRDKDTDATHPTDPRLVKLLYKLADHFKAKQINIISGYREPKDSKGKESHHSDGTAIDFMMPGIKLPALAKVARRLGHVGVGYYPSSGFIHLDVRKGTSYFWADPSGPGKPGCLRRIMPKSGYKFDAKWKIKKDEPKRRKNKKGKLLGKLSDEEITQIIETNLQSQDLTRLRQD